MYFEEIPAHEGEEGDGAGVVHESDELPTDAISATDLTLQGSQIKDEAWKARPDERGGTTLTYIG